MIVVKFIGYPQKDEHAAGQSDSQSEYCDKRYQPVALDIA